MKSKKLIALAIATALAVSSAGITAFAGTYDDFANVPGHIEENGTQKIVINWVLYNSDGTSASDWTWDEGSYVYQTGSNDDGTLDSGVWNNGYSFSTSDLELHRGLFIGETFAGYAKTPDGAPEDSLTITDEEVGSDGSLKLYAVYKEAEGDELFEQAKTLLSFAEEAATYVKENPTEDDTSIAYSEAISDLKRAKEFIEKSGVTDSDLSDRIAEVEKLIEEARAAVENTGADPEAATIVATDPDSGAVYTKSDVKAIPGKLDSSIDEKELISVVPGSNHYAFDVSIYKDSKKINWEPDNEVSMTVTLDNPYSGKTPSNIKVYHMVKDGDKWKVDGSAISGNFSNGKITFKASSFSPYVLTADLTDAASASSDDCASSDSSSNSSSSSSGGIRTNSPNTGDVSAVPIVLAAVAALGATGAVMYRKRKLMAE